MVRAPVLMWCGGMFISTCIGKKRCGVGEISDTSSISNCAIQLWCSDRLVVSAGSNHSSYF